MQIGDSVKYIGPEPDYQEFFGKVGTVIGVSSVSTKVKWDNGDIMIFVGPPEHFRVQPLAGMSFGIILDMCTHNLHQRKRGHIVN